MALMKNKYKIAHDYHQRMVRMGKNEHVPKSVLWILLQHVGRENAITQEKLTSELGMSGYKSFRRRLQMEVRELRLQGFLICSTAGEGAKGYFIPTSLEEYQEFEESEFNHRLKSITMTRNAMRKAASAQLGTEYQPDLI